MPKQAAAITIGKNVLVRPHCADDEHLMAHELVHVDQYKRLGYARFTLRYLGAYLRARMAGHSHMAAYRRIPLEVEASWRSRIATRQELEPSAR